MKKLIFIPLLLALCLTLNSCFLFLAMPQKEPVRVELSDIGVAKTFEKAGITLKLTDKFTETESEMGFDAYYTSEFCGVVVLKEAFTLEEGLAERPLEQYIKNVIKNNGYTNIEPQQRDGLWYYVNYNNSSYRCVYSYVYKGTDAFYIVQYIVNSEDEDTLKETIHDWAKATHVS
ncbi:MAG: hypothetical protein IJW00_09280 [Clostridia bacterium]|nr:hypothetical protein [Clostridia bacterium]